MWDWSIGIIQSEAHTKGTEEKLRVPGDLWDNSKNTNIHVMGVPKGEGREKAAEEKDQEVWWNNGPNLPKFENNLYGSKKMNPMKNKHKTIHA